MLDRERFTTEVYDYVGRRLFRDPTHRQLKFEPTGNPNYVVFKALEVRRDGSLGTSGDKCYGKNWVGVDFESQTMLPGVELLIPRFPRSGSV